MARVDEDLFLIGAADCHLDDRRITFNVGIETDSYQALKSLVKTGHGFAVLPLGPIQNEIETGELRHASIVDPSPGQWPGAVKPRPEPGS